MARTLKSTGPAAKLQFLIGVDSDSPSTGNAKADIKVYKSLGTNYAVSEDLAAEDNTAAVNADMTVATSYITVGTDTWNGHAVSWFRPGYSGGVQGVTFGTNKPFVDFRTGSQDRGLYFVISKDTDGTTNMQMHGGSNNWPKLKKNTGTSTIYLEAAGAVAAASTSTVAHLADVMFAASLKYNVTASNKVYLVAEGGTLSGPDTNNMGLGEACYGSLSTVGMFSGDDQAWYARIILVGCMVDDYASDGARETDLAAILADPYGTFFSAGGVGTALTGVAATGAQGSFGKALNIQL